MALVTERRSSLNPHAEPFIPASYRQVEDFSPAWWELVKSSSWFRNYWLTQHQDDDFGGTDLVDDVVDDDDMMLECAVDEFMSLEELELEFDGVADESTYNDGGSSVLGLGAGKQERKLPNGLHVDPTALLENLSVPKSPKQRSPKSPVAPPKFFKKSGRNVSVKSAPWCIHQPR